MERKVLKRRIKGLAAFVLAVVMMFGSSLSVLAASYSLECDYIDDRYVIDNYTLTVGTIITREDDITNSISCAYGLRCQIDEGAMSEVGYAGSGETIYFSEFLEEGKSYKVTAVEPNGKYMEITVETIVNSGEEGGNGDAGEDCDHTGEDCTHKDNSVGSGENKEEPKAEEPKENEEQVFTRELLTRAATAKAGDTVAIDATVWHSFNANVLKELLSKEGVRYIFYYNYGGECFYITIPAGAVLEEGCEWYGPLKLNAMFGRTMIDKKELHAAINK